MQDGVFIGGQHRDGEDAQVGLTSRVDRRPHGLRIGVHREERGAQPHDALDALAHRVADVVQLEIEKDLLAGARELFRRKREPARRRAS